MPAERRGGMATFLNRLHYQSLDANDMAGYEALGDLSGQARAGHALGFALLLMGQVEEARSAARLALARAQAADDGSATSGAWSSCGVPWVRWHHQPADAAPATLAEYTTNCWIARARMTVST